MACRCDNRRGMPFTLQRWFIALVLCAATAAQTLGVVHGVAHDAPAGHAHASDAGPGHGLDLHDLLVPGEDDAHCAVLDQLSHPAPGTTAAGCVAIAPPVMPAATLLALASILAWRAFDARAPPPIH